MSQHCSPGPVAGAVCSGEAERDPQDSAHRELFAEQKPSRPAPKGAGICPLAPRRSELCRRFVLFDERVWSTGEKEERQIHRPSCSRRGCREQVRRKAKSKSQALLLGMLRVRLSLTPVSTTTGLVLQGGMWGCRGERAAQRENKLQKP